MIFSSVLLPLPLTPSTPILAPGKKDSEMSFRICRFGGTILPTRFMVKTYWAMDWFVDGMQRWSRRGCRHNPLLSPFVALALAVRAVPENDGPARAQWRGIDMATP